MQIIGTRTIEGPNVFTHRPTVLMTLDLQDLHERESCDLPGFTERLIERLPGLAEHVCSKGYPGGFVARLREGTYLGHVVEHVAIEWGQAIGATGNYGKTVRSARPHCFDIAVTSCVHQATRHLLHPQRPAMTTPPPTRRLPPRPRRQARQRLDGRIRRRS